MRGWSPWPAGFRVTEKCEKNIVILTLCYFKFLYLAKRSTRIGEERRDPPSKTGFGSLAAKAASSSSPGEKEGSGANGDHE